MATTIDQQFVEYIVKTLVNNPDKVEIKRDIDEKGVLLSLTVDPEDIGRVIGKRGATAQSIRTLLRALGTKNDARYNLKIINNDDYVPRERVERGTTAGIVDTVSEDLAAMGTDEVVENSPKSSKLAEKTRQELADLDDLDI
ncbi:MAG: KH domain-containing protein [Candidatus Nomurabacteria bacterium]|jgi:predicted RNA-binding protein YlqC (UPF0109 family)|nr:KH domain-containing protein [Candidatus Nomurabacteria bacterium]